ncbi:GNAT family N-acetyltransferase [Microseira wollei]|uniref:GCN5-like N-acetyltransferase n=1 Tax=Microseira wollei NIES-4236 TaxID=2530354 RepID=A0AAV3XFS0_9CYAN|nr:GNAT family N-acetyltransferase [Microseira wollei]GET41239.1 GCN5-like N-acetyltransferase [Microseira wollei NIES-4236]
MYSNLPNLTIRAAQSNDTETIFQLIQGLAEYEKLSHEVVGNPQLLHQHLFGEPKYIEAILAVLENKTVGFAVYLHNYSTYLTKPGIYLKDIFVLPEYRRQGIGKTLLAKVAKIALERNCGYLEWRVLDWNISAQEFYRSMGADLSENWRICHVNEKKLIILSNN